MFCLSHSHMNYVVLCENEKDKTPLSGITGNRVPHSNWHTYPNCINLQNNISKFRKNEFSRFFTIFLFLMLMSR